MLKELYDYAINNIDSFTGFTDKDVSYYITFDTNGNVSHHTLTKPNIVACPDIGSVSQGTLISDIIVASPDIILNLEDRRKNKHEFYMWTMREIGKFIPEFSKVADYLEKQRDNIINIIEELPKDIKISIEYDGKPLEKKFYEEYANENSELHKWWEDFRPNCKKRWNEYRTKNNKQVSSKSKEKPDLKVRCLITGDLIKPIKTAPEFNGLKDVGGRKQGERIICYDKDAYQSYNLAQDANAAVSEEAIFKINAALNQLLSGANVNTQPHCLAGAKHIHWYSSRVEDEDDLLDFYFFDNEDDASDELRISKLYDCLNKGECPSEPKNRYYMISLSGVKGRTMVRSYEEGTYGELFNNLKQWFDDLSLYGLDGANYPTLQKIHDILMNIEDKSAKDYQKRMGEKLARLSPKIIHSAFHNTPLPDIVAVKANNYIRSSIYSNNHHDIDRVSCQILKAWLNRKYRSQKKEEFLIMEKLNANSPSQAYHFGRMFAVFAAIQRRAMGNVGTGIVERYFSSACTSPALVFGKLAMMSENHLSKIRKGNNENETESENENEAEAENKNETEGENENKNKFNPIRDVIYYRNMLNEIGSKISKSETGYYILPKIFTLEQQSEFALGYYAQNAEIYSPNNKKKKQKENEED